MTQALPVPDVLADFESDEALAAAARETPADFGALYERHMPRVYRYLLTRSSSRDEAARPRVVSILEGARLAGELPAGPCASRTGRDGIFPPEGSGVQVSPATPESTFTYEAPEGVTVVEVTDIGQAKDAISGLLPRATDSSEPCPPPMPDGRKSTANEC